MKIVISGTAASGKSSAAKLLAQKLGYKHYSMGDLQREIAKEQGVDILQLGKLEAKDDKFDRMIDQRQIDIGKNEDNFVVDSWLGAHFIPDAVKIFIDAGLEIRAKRRLSHKRKEESFSTLEHVKKDILERAKVNRERWCRYYRFDYEDMKNYDLVIDTTSLTVAETVAKIMHFIQKI